MNGTAVITCERRQQKRKGKRDASVHLFHPLPIHPIPLRSPFHLHPSRRRRRPEMA
uniref:Uncharacterized protein n=1 Tax=Arundo donax TaxID=35708 RepID=A0A0A9ETQ8_ARUDO